MVRNGVVIKLKKRHAIVFNDIMEYEQIKRVEGMFEGQMIEYQASEKSGIYNKLKLLSGAAAVLMLLAAVFFGWLAESSGPHVFAYIGLDINPSVEFSIDDSSKVISTRALNDDGEKLIKPLSLKGKPIDRAITEVVQELKKDKIIKDEGVILISTSLQAEDKAVNEVKESDRMLKKTIGRIQEKLEKDYSFNISVKVVSLEPELRKDCLANNISMGRYALYEKASNSGVKVSLQQARNQPVSDLVKFIEEVDKDPANAQAIRKGLISNTPPVNMPEGRIANQDNNRPEKSSAITAFKMKDNSAAPNPATVKTPDGNKSGEKSPISVNRPTSVSSPKRIPAHTDSNDNRVGRDSNPGPDKIKDHIGPGQTPGVVPTQGMPPLVTPKPHNPLPERPPISSPDKGELPHQDKRPDLPDKRPDLPDGRSDLPGKGLNDMPRVDAEGTKTP